MLRRGPRDDLADLSGPGVEDVIEAVSEERCRLFDGTVDDFVGGWVEVRRDEGRE